MEWQLERVPALYGCTVECADGDGWLVSRRQTIYRTKDLTAPRATWTRIADAPAPPWRALAARARLGQRLLRFLTTNVVPRGNDDLFGAFDRRAGVMAWGRWHDVAGLLRPCRILRHGCAVTPEGDVYFGEYVDNAARGPIRVYRLPAGARRLDVAHEFPAGAVRHVHGVYRDPVNGALLCLTGDAGRECRMTITTDGFRTIDEIGGGDESWRAVSVVFRDEAWYYGTDAEHRANRIVRVNRRTGQRDTIADVDGTVFYSAACGPDLFFGTTAETAPSQREDVASIWHVSPADECRRIATFPKDRWHRTLFMYGLIHFSRPAPGARELYVHLVGATPDNATFRLAPRCRIPAGGACERVSLDVIFSRRDR